MSEPFPVDCYYLICNLQHIETTEVDLKFFTDTFTFQVSKNFSFKPYEKLKGLFCCVN